MQGDREFYRVKAVLEPCLRAAREVQALQTLAGRVAEDEVTGLADQLRVAEHRLELSRAAADALLRECRLPVLEYRVVVERYLHAKKWDDVVTELDRTRRHVLRLHSSALHRMARALSGV